MNIMENGNLPLPKGFKAAGVHCGIRKNTTKKDLALIYAEKRCNAAAVYTQNLVKGAPIIVTKSNLLDGMAQAVICNSGNANTCNADGEEKANEVCAFLGEKLGISKKDVIIASTGVIGQPINNAAILNKIPDLINELSADGLSSAASGILTTDTKIKQAYISIEISGKPVAITGICKGSGMINPNMATMLGFITTDAAISSEMLEKALKKSVETTFNMVSVDGDTSTNDMVSIMASGLAENDEIKSKNSDFDLFCEALQLICLNLSRKMAKDGEGATKLVECWVKNAEIKKIAANIAKKVISSSLVKAAMFGSDANWGRVLCAIGYSGSDVDISKIDVVFDSKTGRIKVCENGAGLNFCEDTAKKILLDDDIIIEVDLKSGQYEARAFGCDLTYDYVKINGDYRS